MPVPGPGRVYSQDEAGEKPFTEASLLQRDGNKCHAARVLSATLVLVVYRCGHVREGSTYLGIQGGIYTGCIPTQGTQGGISLLPSPTVKRVKGGIGPSSSPTVKRVKGRHGAFLAQQ